MFNSKSMPRIEPGAGFAAGTPVHTEQGLVPIEKIRVGAHVLSQPEQGGERDYRPVINTVAIYKSM